MEIPAKWQWFSQDRFGLFIHWGAYSQYGRGEQVLFREHLDQAEYEQNACRWNPLHFDAAHWAKVAKQAGFRYAVMTTRHHDGYCLWNSKLTDYTSMQQAPKRDFIREYVEAFRAEGLRIGFYYSLADWRIPAYWEGPQHDPEGWEIFRSYVHGQVDELMTDYGEISLVWFDGAWPHSGLDWNSPALVARMRSLQPGILINNRLGLMPEEGDPSIPHADGGMGVGESRVLGDYGTPEHAITAEEGRLWESCQVSTWRLWGYTIGERWRSADLLLDMLVEAAGKGGNLLLNVGPKADGTLPPEFLERAEEIGKWMDVHEEAVRGSEPGEVCEFVSYGRQTRKGNTLYLIIRFWDERPTLHLAGLKSRVQTATLVTTGQELKVEQSDDHLYLHGLPRTRPTPLFPVIKLECNEPPQACDWAVDRLWCGDPRRMTPWAEKREGHSVNIRGR